MKYCITMERVQRVAVWFDAGCDQQARAEGIKILLEHQDHPEQFSSGSEEFDYAICSGDGRDVVKWS